MEEEFSNSVIKLKEEIETLKIKNIYEQYICMCVCVAMYNN